MNSFYILFLFYLFLSLSSAQGMFYDLKNENETLVNYAVNPIVREYDRMVYLSLSEYFFDSGLFSYFKGGLFQTQIANERVRRHLVRFKGMIQK